MNYLTAIHLSLCGLCLMGCERPSKIQENKLKNDNSDFLGLKTDRKYDFGKCLITPQLNLTHHYPIRNNTGQPIKLLRALNQKPCCGDIKFDPVILNPGDSYQLTVVLKHNQSNNPLSHLAIIETDHPLLSFLEFYTFADPQPVFLLERGEDTITSINIGESKRVALNFHCFGDAKNKPIDLDQIRIETDLGFEWVGPTAQISNRDGFLENIRKGELVFKGQAPSGSRISAVQVKDNEKILYNDNFAWEVGQILKANPAVLLISNQSVANENTIVITSIDRKDFKITEIIPDQPGLKVSKPNQIDSSSSSFVAKFEQIPSSTRSGVVKIMTTHPNQSSLALSYFYISRDKNDEKRDTKNAQE